MKHNEAVQHIQARSKQMSIWIVKKHARAPNSYGNWRYLEAFTIFSTHATKAEAQEVAAKKMRNKNTTYLYTVGRVQLKEASFKLYSD